jgi:hypothetical protein
MAGADDVRTAPSVAPSTSSEATPPASPRNIAGKTSVTI